MLSVKKGSHWYHFNAFGMAWPGILYTTPDPEADALPLELSGPVDQHKEAKNAIQFPNMLNMWLNCSKQAKARVFLFFVLTIFFHNKLGSEDK